MRIEGKLSKWNEARGFGFITPVGEGGDVFVHISAFPRSSRPRLNEQLFFEIEQGKDGKTRAINIQRPGQLPYRLDNRSYRRRKESSFRDIFKSGVMLFAIGCILYSAITGKLSFNQFSNSKGAASEMNASPQDIIEENFECDGRTHCSEMTSCEEAEFFLENCPGTQMDGNNDGEPCESQWCGY